jgi:hypothetical protein
MVLNEGNLTPAYHSRVQKIIERIDGVNPENESTVEVFGGALLKLAEQFHATEDAGKKQELASAVEAAGERIIYDINHLTTDGFFVKDLRALDAAEAKVQEVLDRVRSGPTSDITHTHEINPVGETIYKGTAK